MPEVIDAIGRYRMAIEQLERGQASVLASRWAQLMQGLNSEIELLATEMAERTAQGLPAKLWHLRRMERYQSLMRQMGTVVNEYAPIAQADIVATEQLLVRLGLEHSQALIDMQTPTLTMMFDRLPVDAFEGMIGNTAAGTPLADLFTAMPRETGQAVTDALLKGTGLGWHPTKTAQAMREGAAMTYQRSVLIARTEQLRIYREVTRQQYIASDLVEGYRRVASKTSRTCIGCLMTDGMFFELDVPFEEHPAGRCVAVPEVKGKGKVTWETGEEWLQRQSPSVQREIMGPGRFDAWQSGRVQLGDMVTKRVDPVWGNSYVPTPLKDLQ